LRNIALTLTAGWIGSCRGLSRSGARHAACSARCGGIAYDLSTSSPVAATNCFRAEWGAKVYAAGASVIATGALNGSTALEALRAGLAGVPVMRSG
jgi:hypothetical protein